MRTANRHAAKLFSNVSRRRLVNNVQRVLFTLINANTKSGWVPRTSLRVPSVGARVRDLRKAEFGGFRVECKSAADLNVVSRAKSTSRQTFYRIVPNSVTVTGLNQVLKGVI